MSTASRARAILVRGVAAVGIETVEIVAEQHLARHAELPAFVAEFEALLLEHGDLLGAQAGLRRLGLATGQAQHKAEQGEGKQSTWVEPLG